MSDMYIVAEIGCNHNGNKEIAKQMIDVAKSCGVDAVKFQTFKSELLISRYAPKAEYQKVTTGIKDSQLEMTKKLELSQKDYLELRDYATELGLDVFSTGFDEESNDFLFNSGQNVWKIPSGEITNLPYLRQISNYKQDEKTVILSTGMSTIEEIRAAVDILERDKKTKVIILHCNTEYPTQDEDVNVSAIIDLQKQFPNNEVGFSDHSVGVVAAVMAVAYGVRFIEKHFTLDKNMDGPDHKASVNPEELKQLCEITRRAEIQKGIGTKVVTESERKNKIVARKSIVAKTSIAKGDVFTLENITCKRPGNGISPMFWDEIIGKEADRNYKADELIESEGFEWQKV